MTRESRFDVTAVGEQLLRLSVPAGRRLEETESLAALVAGAEGNTLAALGGLARRCGLVTSLPASPLGRLVRRRLAAAGVDLNAVEREQGRLGTFFVELARSPAPTRVFYDRQDSCAARLEPDEVDWPYLSDSRILHLTGITAALSPTCREIVRQALARSREGGLPISFDVNHRDALWSPADARGALLPLVEEVELLFCSARDARRVFRLSGDADTLAPELADLTGARAVVVSSGPSGAFLWHERALSHASALAVDVVDRLGAGDALAAGVIDGWLDGDVTLGLRRGVALAALALTHHGEFVTSSRGELDELTAAVPADGVRR